MVRRSRKTRTAAVHPVAADPAIIEAHDISVVAAAIPSAVARPRAASKLSIVLGLLQAPEGASLAKLVAVTNWLPHTTRAALTGLRKRGYAIANEKIVADDGARHSVYRIAAGQAQ